MKTYEIRFLNQAGDTTLLYVTECGDDDDAMNRLLGVKAIHGERFELWEGSRKVRDGEWPIADDRKS